MPFGDFSDRKFRRRSVNDQVSRLQKDVRNLMWREHAQDMSTIYDDIIGNVFISPVDPTIVDPSAPTFSGIAIGAKGWTFGGTVYNVAGVLAGALQAGFNNLGKFLFGGGTGTLDDTGASIEAVNGSTIANLNSYKFVSGGSVVSRIGHWIDSVSNFSTLALFVNNLAGKISHYYAQASSNTEAQASLHALDTSGGAEAKLQLYASGGSSLAVLTADEIDLRATTFTQKGVANGFASLDASSRVVEAIQRVVSGTAALTTTEGYVEWQSTTKRLLSYDAQRERALSSIGWTPLALPLIYDPSAALTTAYSIAANGGTLAIPILVAGHMLLQGVTVRNTDTASARSWRWHLYEQYLNNGNASENTLTRIESGNGNDSFTPGAASNRTLNGTGAPTYLAPGVYWLAIQNVHATNTFGLGSTAAGSAFAPNSAQSKTLTVPLGSTLDFVAATWTKVADLYAVRLNGRVFGQTTAF